MVTFETQADFESAVMAVIVEKLGVTVETRGHPFINNVRVGLFNTDDGPWACITESADGCS